MMKAPLYLSVFFSLALAACDGSGITSSNSIDLSTLELPDPEKVVQNIVGELESTFDTSELSLDAFGPLAFLDKDLQTELESKLESIPGQDLVKNIDILDFKSRDGINVETLNYSLTETGDPRITLRINNTSDEAIHLASCDVTALQDDIIVQETQALFADFGVIDAGESAVYPARLADLAAGFNGFDRIHIGCGWEQGESDRVDIGDGPVQVEFLDYSLSPIGKPAIRMMLTNDSENTITGGQCRVEVKRENTILDVASLFFDTVESGEALDAEGIFFLFDSLDGFDPTEFELSNVNCSYQVA